MDRSRIASAVAGDLFAAEEAVEEALARTVRLMRGMIDARRALDLPATVGVRALQRVTAALDALGDAQREIFRTHGELDVIRQDAGLRVVGFGPLVKPFAGAAEDQRAD